MISTGNWDMTVYSPVISRHCQAGQFVHVRIGDSFNPFLRRPLSIGPCDGDYLRLIFTVKGIGTKILSEKQPGDMIDLIGPLGKPFYLPDEKSCPVLIGGGIGVVPLLTLDDHIKKAVFLLGVQSKTSLTVDESEINQRGISIASDDGSIGFNGNVVQLFEKTLQQWSGTEKQKIIVYACGPMPMMIALKSVCAKFSIKAYLSLEAPMACGVGACQSCVVRKAKAEGYYLVCQDGPVFDAQDVELQP
ncbi:MAG: dihydroorotate dehydrogenase electron transfer subunit [Candidatus Hatepunaea meridiana]|nr:dihydroorotate dehydrogenase electron transfer subunit [Candidatus Hatepunaea meridiana]